MDDLERRIRAARPVSGHRDLPLTDRAKRELADFLVNEAAHVPATRSRSSRRRGWWVLGAAAAVLTVAVVVPIRLLSGTPAYAATPPLLHTTPMPGTAVGLLQELSAAARADSTPPATGVVRISVEAWTLSMEDNGTSITTTVQPERYEITRYPDGSIHQVIASGAPLGPVTKDTLPEGRVVSDDTWPSGEGLVFSTSAPSDPRKVAKFLSEDVGEAPPFSAASSLESISSLLLEQVLGSAQKAAILDYLAKLPGLVLSGSTTDRLGRAGIMFSAPDPDEPDYTEHVVVARDTGRILAMERTYHGTSRTDIPSPSVVHYFAWK